jgi:hypothetical protein
VNCAPGYVKNNGVDSGTIWDHPYFDTTGTDNREVLTDYRPTGSVEWGHFGSRLANAIQVAAGYPGFTPVRTADKSAEARGDRDRLRAGRLASEARRLEGRIKKAREDFAAREAATEAAWDKEWEARRSEKSPSMDSVAS